MEDCDEDVIFEGSALYHHLVSSGYESELEVFNKIPDEIKTELENNDCSPLQEKSSKSRSNIVSCILGINYDSLVIEVAKQAIDSKLLVDEDVDFLKNFLQLEVKAKKAAGPALWSVPVAVGPLAFLASTSSSVSRVTASRLPSVVPPAHGGCLPQLPCPIVACHGPIHPFLALHLAHMPR